jgi:hypothetical protein
MLHGLSRLYGVVFEILHSMFFGMGRKGSWVQELGGTTVNVGIDSSRVRRARKSIWVDFIVI